jgi:uncharacterized RDD family membrane protein YckC
MRFRDLKKQSSKNNQTNNLKQPIKSAYYIYRIKALIVDLFMIYMPIMYIMTYGFLDGKDDLAASTLAPLIATLVYGFIYSIFLSKTGQTPGKKAYDIQVVDAKTHQNIVIFRAFFRFITFLFTVTTVLGLFLPFIRKDKRTLHDILAGTIVRHLESK